jgi:LacI family transcriptional regulator
MLKLVFTLGAPLGSTYHYANSDIDVPYTSRRAMIPRSRIRDVASRAGVSTATVSRALSNPALVRPDTQLRIREAIAALGYVPDGSARALASGRARTIGAVVPTLDNAIFARAVQGLQTTLSNSGYQLLIAAHEYNPAAEQDLVRALLERSIDALLVVGTDHAPQTWDLIHASRVPLLVTWSKTELQPSIGFDNHLIGRLAALHLLALGHKHMGVISGHFLHNDRARNRVEGFREVLQQNGCQLPDAYILEQPFGFEGGHAGLKALLRLDPRPTAVFCGNDALALGCLFEARAMGVDVPGELSIVGCDNLPISSQVTPSLTTIHLPTHELGQRAATVLLQWLATGTPPQSECLPIKLVARGTSAPPKKT